VAYGFRDIVRVAAFGSLVGAAIYLVVAGTVGALVWNAARSQAARTPTPNDKPIEILRKLGRQGLGVRVVQATVQGRNGNLYVLQTPGDGNNKLLVGPAIGLIYEDDTPGPDLEVLRGQVNAQRGADGDPEMLWQILTEAARKNQVTIQWHPVNETNWPFYAEAGHYTLLQVPAPVVEEI